MTLGKSDDLSSGQEAFAGGFFRQALADFEVYTDGNGGDPLGWLYLGLAHRELGNLEASARALDRALALTPADLHLLLVRARIELERGGADAVDRFERVRALLPDDARILLGEAAALYQAGRGERAVALLQPVVRANPGWHEGFQALARLRWQLGDGARSADDIKATLRESPANGLLWAVYLGIVSKTAGHEAMLALLSKARGSAGGNILFDMLEAEALSESGQAERAEPLLGRIPESRDIPFGLVRLRHFLRTDRPAEAIALGQTLLGQAGDAAVWPYLSLAWRVMGDPRAEWLEGDERLVTVTDLPIAGPEIAKLAAILRGLHKGSTHPFDQSPRGGTQTDGPLFSRSEPEIGALQAVIREAGAAHIAQLPPPDPAHPHLSVPRSDFRFIGSWSVRLTGGGFHTSHVHTHGWISSALYVSVPETIGEDGNAGWLALGAPPPELGLSLPPTRLVEPKPGRLVLFPSTMWHGTLPFEAGERLTIAFDVAPLAG